MARVSWIKKYTLKLWWSRNVEMREITTLPNPNVEQPSPTGGVRVSKELADKVYTQPQNQFHDSES